MRRKKRVLKNGDFGGGSVSVIVSLRGSNTLNSEEKGKRRVWSECGCGCLLFLFSHHKEENIRMLRTW